MITCEEFASLTDKGCLSCTNAERTAWVVHIESCSECKSDVMGRSDVIRRHMSSDELAAICLLATSIRDGIMADEECASILPQSCR